MDLKATKKELAAAYEKLEEVEAKVTNLIIERREIIQVIEVLKAAGLLNDEKLFQAREIIMGLDC